MWLSLLGVLQALGSAMGKLLDYLSSERLVKAGRDELAGELHDIQAAGRKEADEIAHRPLPADPQSILSRL